VPAPLETPYAVFLVLLVIALVATAAIPETVDRGQRRRYRPQRIAIPAAARGAFWAAGTGAFTGFAVFGLMMALTPTVLAQAMGVTSRLAAGPCRSPSSCPRPSRRCSPCASACVVNCCCRGS
jgi:hypothetical protein